MKGFNEFVAQSKDYDEIIIWGAGDKTKELLNNSEFLQNIKIKYIVDSSSIKIGTTLCGYIVCNPSVILKTSCKVIISSYVHGVNILNEYYNLGLKENQLVKKFIL